MMAQAPNAIKYQAVARDANGDVIANQSVSLTISILQGSVTGTEVFTETHDSTTNAYGLVSLNIGAGNPTDFANIDWANGPYFVKVVMDGNDMGTNQLLCVPYAKYADNAGNVFSGSYNDLTDVPANYADQSALEDTASSLRNDLAPKNNVLALDNTTAFTPDADYEPATKKYVDDNVGGGSTNDFYLGQDTLGGIVFYIYLDANGNQHGLIVSKTETTAQWQSTTSTTNATRSWDGVYNMNLMINSPAKTWVTSLGADWYLPSIDELSLLWHNRFHANKGLNDAGATLLSNTASCWSSTEYSASIAFIFNFNLGNTSNDYKANTYSVRAVRAF